MAAKRLLFVSLHGLIADIAWQAQREGDAVKMAVLNPKAQEMGLGLVPRSTAWEKDLQWADTVIFDDSEGLGEKADWARKQGATVVGGTAYTDRLEEDRSFGQKELAKHGIAILPHYDFSSFDEGIDFIGRNPGSYVLKPYAGAPEVKKMLFVGEDPKGWDVAELLKHYAHTETGAWSYQLQKKVSGVEVCIQAFFDGEKFVMPTCVGFEHKRFFTGDLGPQTGEMGTSMFWSGPNRLYKETIALFAPRLKEAGFCGSFDLNCIVNEEGIHPLEFTPRFGYPQIHIQQEGFAEPIGNFLHQLPRRQLTKFSVKPGFQVGVQVRVPPYPYDDLLCWQRLSKNIGIDILGNDYAGIHPGDVKVVAGRWVLAGSDGCPLVVCGSGLTLKAAQQQAYERVKKVHIPNAYYRTDIGDRWYNQAEGDKLLIWGYLSA